MPITPELMQAMNMFGKAATEYGISSGINDASKAVEKLKKEELDEFKVRAGQQEIANQLQSRMTGLGASGSAIASAVGAVQPEAMKSAADYARKFTETGKQEYADAASSMAKQEGILARDQKKPMMDAESAERQKDRQLQWDIATLNNDGKKKEGDKAKKAGEISFETNVAQAGNFIGELRDAVTRNGTWESEWMPNANDKDAATLKQTPYKLAITYAKIVDPDSVAREGEVAAAQKYLIELGATKNKKAVLSQINLMEKTIKQYGTNRAAAASGKAPAAAAPADTSKTAVIIDPTGTHRLVPASEVDRYLKMGATLK